MSAEQPHIGGFCDACGHLAMRHNESGCHFPRPVENPCTCEGMAWCGAIWPRPWLPAPDGLEHAEQDTSSKGARP